MVSGQTDYCNSLLYKVSKGSVAKPQKVQHVLCLIVFKLGKLSHATPYLEKTPLASYSILYPIQIQPSIFKAKNFSKPPYFSSLMKSSSLTHGNRLSISSVRPRKAMVVLPW